MDDTTTPGDETFVKLSPEGNIKFSQTATYNVTKMVKIKHALKNYFLSPFNVEMKCKQPLVTTIADVELKIPAL
jgi:hypothetical protein